MSLLSGIDDAAGLSLELRDNFELGERRQQVVSNGVGGRKVSTRKVSSLLDSGSVAAIAREEAAQANNVRQHSRF